MLPKNLFNKHTHIGIDLDETLALSVVDGLEKLHKMGRMKSISSMEDITSFHWWSLGGADMTEEELMSFWSSHSLDNTHPVEGSIDGIFSLFQKEKNIHVITARNESHHKTDTQKWLDLYFPEIHPAHIHFANHLSKENRPKSVICKSLSITLMIDDGYHNALDLAENNIECILIDKPWNRNIEKEHPLIYRVKDWGEIIDNIK